MAQQVTVRELRAVVKSINDTAKELGILEGEEWTEQTGAPAHLVGTSYQFPHLGLDEGSATYGRAWRIFATGGTRYQTGHSDPFHIGSGFLGSTKSEAMRALRGIEAGLWAAKLAAEKAAR